jgi:hypothetical protein
MLELLRRLEHKRRIYRRKRMIESAAGGDRLHIVAVGLVLASIVVPVPFLAGWLLVPVLLIAGLLMLFTIILAPFGIALL